MTPPGYEAIKATSEFPSARIPTLPRFLREEFVATDGSWPGAENPVSEAVLLGQNYFSAHIYIYTGGFVFHIDVSVLRL